MSFDIMSFIFMLFDIILFDIMSFIFMLFDIMSLFNFAFGI
jgi:hypothetical protein